MHQQTVKNPPLKFGKGILAVATLMVMVIADSVLTQMLEPWLGAGTAVVIFWALGALIAMYAMRRYVMSFSYAANSNMLQITFAYGRYRRMMEEIYFTVEKGEILCGRNSELWSFDGTTITVVNVAGTELPNSGGIGTQFGTMAGLLIMAGSLICGFLMRRKRRRRCS
jgi:LPXTG-motif cell wall-anchored protein